MAHASDDIQDAARLAALRRAALLDTPAEESFDRLTRLASKILQVPMSLVSLVDKDRQFFKSQVGLPPALATQRETSLSHSFCKYVVLSGQPLVVTDARLDERLKDNPVIPMGVVAYAGFPLVTGDGYVLGSFCALDNQPHEWSDDQLEILRELTHSVMTEIELRSANFDLRATNEAKDRFMAMLSHDLRTPLSPALITASQLAQNTSASASVREDAQLIQRNIELEVRMIDSLLDLTRIRTGKLTLTREKADVHALLRATVEMCRAEAAERPVMLTVELTAHRHVLEADGPKLMQLFCNVMKNAVKFSRSGGAILVRTTDAPAGVLRIDCIDNGVGIASERLRHIFDPFEQGGAGVTQHFGGLGLGLAICRGIAEAHGGTIDAASAGENAGTTITVALPGAEWPDAALSAAPAPTVRRATKPRILLVEDHEDSLRAMSKVLKSFHYDVTTSMNVAEALACAAVADFDLLICDLGLPDGTGTDLMRALCAARPIPGIALTGYGMEADIQQTKDAGFKRHFIKPIDFLELNDAIQAMFQS